MRIKSFITQQQQEINEKKDHIINKLSSLSPEEKEILIGFFKNNPHLEKEIDWNNNNLVFKDFREVLDSVSKTRLKKEVSAKGISGLREGKDYVDCTFMFGRFGPKAYAPLDHNASRLIASKRVGSVEGKWCTAENDPQYWNQYSQVGVILIYLVESDGDKKAIAVYKNGNIEMFDSEDIDLSNTYISKDYRDMIHNHLSFIDDHIRAKIKINPPAWFSKAKTRNAKWHYSETNAGFFIMDSGEWIDGVWEYGQMKDDVDFKGGTFKGGFFNGNFYGGTFAAGTFKGTWHGGTWKDSALTNWDDGKHPSGMVMIVPPNKWAELNSIIIDLSKYFTMDEETIKELPKQYLDEGKHLLLACKKYNLVNRIGYGANTMRLKLKTGGVYVYNAIVDGFNNYKGFGITFIGSEIHSCESEVYYDMCDFEAGRYESIYESVVSGCNINGGTFILKMNSKNHWENFDNKIMGGSFICVESNSGTFISDRTVSNATFNNLFIEVSELNKCTLEYCYVNHDIVKVLKNCKLINTKEYNTK